MSLLLISKKFDKMHEEKMHEEKIGEYTLSYEPTALSLDRAHPWAPQLNALQHSHCVAAVTHARQRQQQQPQIKQQ